VSKNVKEEFPHLLQLGWLFSWEALWGVMIIANFGTIKSIGPYQYKMM